MLFIVAVLAGCSRTMEEGHLTPEAWRLLKEAGVNELHVVTAVMALGFDWQNNFMEFHEARGIYDLSIKIASGDYVVGEDLPDEPRLYEMVSALTSPPPSFSSLHSTRFIPRRLHTHMPSFSNPPHMWQHNTHSLPTTRTRLTVAGVLEWFRDVISIGPPTAHGWVFLCLHVEASCGRGD